MLEVGQFAKQRCQDILSQIFSIVATDVSAAKPASNEGAVKPVQVDPCLTPPGASFLDQSQSSRLHLVPTPARPPPLKAMRPALKPLQIKLANWKCKYDDYLTLRREPFQLWISADSKKGRRPHSTNYACAFKARCSILRARCCSANLASTSTSVMAGMARAAASSFSA